MTGVDFTGALYIREKDRECKVYVSVFGYLWYNKSRALGDIVTNLTVEDFCSIVTESAHTPSQSRQALDNTLHNSLSQATQLRKGYREQSIYTHV